MAATKKTESAEAKPLKGMVIVVGTEASKDLATGKEYEVSARLAETLVKKGSATYKK